jgi:hypothetical protein
MTLRAVFAVVLLAAPMVTGCATGADGDGRSHADNPQNPNPPTQGIGPAGGIGATPRDMAGGGRGSTGPHGR